MGVEDDKNGRVLLTDVVIKEDNIDRAKKFDSHNVESERLTLLSTEELREIQTNQDEKLKRKISYCDRNAGHPPQQVQDGHDCQFSPEIDPSVCLCNSQKNEKESRTLSNWYRDSGHYSFQDKNCMDRSEYELQHHRKRHETKPFQKLTFLKSSLLLTVGIIVGLVAMAVLYFSKLSNFSKMQDEIKELKESMKQLNDQVSQHSPLALSSTMEVNQFNRPYTHLTLTAEDSIPLTPWNNRILQWKPTTTQTNAGPLQYNAISRSIYIKEEGTYFVYNQIYIYRHNSHDTTDMNVSNHTVFHSLFRKPYGYPRNRKPITVTEGTVSYCWDERADKQVHTSYQAIIVELQEGDELFVGIEDFDDHLEMLVPKSTYFGLYKL